ncbi:hypothetical protein FSP39_018525, partial [Pinctada imbricata]
YLILCFWGFFSDLPIVKDTYFSVSKKQSTTLSAQNQKIIFDDVLVNRANAYDKSTGVFTCPRRGDYKFSFTILKTTSAKSHIFLMVNNNIQLVTYTPGRHIHETHNGDIILSLQKGDKVYLQGQEKGMGIHGVRYSMFSGMSL